MRSVEQHLAQCLAAVAPLPALEATLLDALDCVLAEDVVSPLALPPFDNSAMDGYAVRIEDVAADGAPALLPVLGDIPAGSTTRSTLPPGATVRIMTGAPLPTGTEAIVPVEWTDGGTTKVAISRAPSPGQYLRHAGDDVAAGETVLRAGARLTPRAIALLAAVGRTSVRVFPRPRVVVLSTGSELVAGGSTPSFGQVFDSNGTGLTAAAIDAGAVARHLGSVGDDPRVLLGVLEDHLPGADVVVTSGGVSAGAYDTVKEVLGRLGTVRFDRVAMQPGMPQGFGTIGPHATPIFTLPGNPVSAMVSFEVFVRPSLRLMRGEAQVHRPVTTAVAAAGWRSPPGKRQFVRAVLQDGDGGPVVTPVGAQGSHLVADLADATCLAVVPESVERVEPGMSLECMLIGERR